MVQDGVRAASRTLDPKDQFCGDMVVGCGA